MSLYVCYVILPFCPFVDFLYSQLTFIFGISTQFHNANITYVENTHRVLLQIRVIDKERLREDILQGEGSDI